MCDLCKQSPCSYLCPNNTKEEMLFCPVCNRELSSVAYISEKGEILGCDQCVTEKNLYND